MKKLMIVIGVIVAALAIAVLSMRSSAENGETASGVEAEQTTAETTTSEEETKEEEKETVHGVALVRAESREVRTFVSGTGTLQASRQVDIFSKTAGQVDKLSLEEGDRVRAGDILLSLDAGTARLQLSQARVKLEEAKAEFNRTARSYEKELVSTQEYENKKFQLEKSQADVDLAEYEVEMSQVVAPFDGTLISRDVELGQTIQTSQKLFTLATLEPLETELYLPERKVAGLRVGMPVEMSLSNSFEASFPGRVDLIAPVVDKETGTVKVTIAVDNVPEDMRPGAYVHLRIVTHREVAQAVIPKKALLYDSRQNTFAYLAKLDSAETQVFSVEKVALEVGIQEDDAVAVQNGLRNGDLVVLTGKESLREGSKVKDLASDSRSLAQK